VERWDIRLASAAAKQKRMMEVPMITSPTITSPMITSRKETQATLSVSDVGRWGIFRVDVPRTKRTSPRGNKTIRAQIPS